MLNLYRRSGDQEVERAARRDAAARVTKSLGNASGDLRQTLVFPWLFMTRLVGRLAGRRGALELDVIRSLDLLISCSNAVTRSPLMDRTATRSGAADRVPRDRAWARSRRDIRVAPRRAASNTDRQDAAAPGSTDRHAPPSESS